MNILNNLRKPYFAMFLATLMLFASCSQHDNDIPIDNLSENSLEIFSGQELFRSIVFMDGEATSLFPVMENNFNIKDYLNTSEKEKEYKDVQERAIKFIQKENPNFFNSFQKNMYSKNPILIKETLLKSAETLKPFLNKELKGKGLKYDVTLSNPKELKELEVQLKSEYARYKNNTAQSKMQASGVLVLAVAVAVVAAVAFYVVVVSEFAFGIANQENSDLLSEELSLSIATELNGSVLNK
jgi:SdpC family antimicrobial peptide